MVDLGMGGVDAPLLMTLNAVFDESGKFADSELVVFGGLIFDPQVIRSEFNRRWGTALRSSGLPLPEGRKGSYLHMVELNSLYVRSSSDRGTQRQIEALAQSLAHCVCDGAMGGSWSTVSCADFRAMPQEARTRYKDPFYYAFESGVLALSKDPSIGPDDEFSLFCDDSEEYSSECLKAYRRLKKLDQSVTAKIPVIAFGDDRVYPPLQASDMFAYCYRALRSGSASDMCRASMEIMLARFSDDPETFV